MELKPSVREKVCSSFSWRQTNWANTSPCIRRGATSSLCYEMLIVVKAKARGEDQSVRPEAKELAAQAKVMR